MGTATVYNKYAMVQMAAEADLPIGQVTVKDLVEGNHRASRFTQQMAERFVKDWDVVSDGHVESTSTGFSATLFRCKTDDPERGLVNGELVLSFRSTEFVDDAARDNQATNSMEIYDYGWAFGQLDDMRSWVKGLQAKGAIPAGQTISVTGYSLGGHLATAFADLFPGLASATYTFNGAGVGDLRSGTLDRALDAFHAIRTGGASTLFSADPVLRLYLRLVTDQFTRLNSTRDLNAACIINAINSIDLLDANIEEGKVAVGPFGKSVAIQELGVLRRAVSREGQILDEVLRVNRGISPGSSGSMARRVPQSEVEALRLDYQLAVQAAQDYTKPGDHRAYFWRDVKPGRGNIIDILGASWPSMVASSQWHYGVAAPVFIEDQPLYRGDPGVMAIESAMYLGIKLLVDGFNQNDFGDTHSLVLVQDSLVLQDLMSHLDPSLDAASLDKPAKLLRQAGHSKSDTTRFTQGKSEYDSLENALDGWRRLLVSPQAERTPTTEEGGHWADPTYRRTFYDNLNTLTAEDGNSAYKAVKGRLHVDDDFTAAKARKDFVAFQSLRLGTPFMATTTDQSAMTAVKGRDSSVAAKWDADNADIDAGRDRLALNFTDVFLQDRARYLALRRDANERNQSWVKKSEGPYVLEAIDLTEPKRRPITTRSPSGKIKRYLSFGNADANSFKGGDSEDHLFGIGGADKLTGLEGNDWLEGGNGSDTLDGGDGMDVLLGGDEDDRLEGGKGLDVVYGGWGPDTYVCAAGDGIDLLSDSDVSTATLEVEGFRDGLPAGIKVNDRMWRSANNKVCYVLVDGDPGEKHLVVSFTDGTPHKGDRLVLKNWSPGDYGISLGSTVPTFRPEARYIGDQRAATSGNGVYLWENTHWDTRTGELIGGVADAGFSDALWGAATKDSVEGLAGNDAITTEAGADWADGGSGDDLVMGGAGSDTLMGDSGNDYLLSTDSFVAPRQYKVDDPPYKDPRGFRLLIHGDTWGVSIDDNTKIVYVPGARTRDLSPDVIDGGDGNDVAIGSDGEDLITGGAGNDGLNGSGGSDVLVGGAGDDGLQGDTLERPEASGADVLDGGEGNDHLFGEGMGDVLYGGAGNDQLSGDAASEVLLSQFHGEDILDGGAGDDQLWGGGQADRLIGGAGNDWLAGETQNSSDDNSLLGGGDWLDGGTGTDSLIGGNDDDTLLGGGGRDAMFGGAGNDLYVIQSDPNQALARPVAPGVSHRAGTSPQAWLDPSIQFGVPDQNLVASGAYVHDAQGADTIRFESEVSVSDTDDDGSLTLAIGDPDWGQTLTLVNAFFGRAGDLEIGGASTSLRDWVQDKFTTDLSLTTAGAPVTYAFGAGGNDDLIGDATQDTDDTLDGGCGNDRLYGFGGQDSLQGAQGNDWINGGDGDDQLAGGEGNDILTDTLGNNVFDGGAGDDEINRGYSVGSDTTFFAYGAGQDTVRSASQTGGLRSNTLVLQGGVTLSDLLFTREKRTYRDERGQDRTAYVDLRVTLKSSHESMLFTYFGTNDDPVHAGTPLSAVLLEDGSQLTLADICRLSVTGGDDADTLVGYLAADLIDGGVGDDWLSGSQSGEVGADDTLLGGDGNDWLNGHGLLDGGSGDDQLMGQGLLQGGEGNDTLRGDGALFGGDGADQMDTYLTDAQGQTWSGGSGDDTLRGLRGNLSGDDGADALEGGAVMAGGRGNDRLVAKIARGSVVFQRGDGSDTYLGLDGENANYTRADRATLTLGSGITLNDLRLTLSGEDLVLKLGGDDAITMVGFFRDDWYGTRYRGADYGASIGTVVLADGSSRDLLSMLRAGTNAAERIAGSSGDDLIAGYVGNDTLQGGAGSDGLNGGAGNDSLEGGDGDDTLSGYQGSDTLVGGLGNDVFFIDRFDKVVESAGGGVDTVVYTANGPYGDLTEYILPGELENLGFGNLTYNLVGTGNGAANRLTGNAYANTLNGLGGNDTLDGGAGNDLLVGGSGNDLYMVDTTDDRITEAAGDGVDTVQSRLSWTLGAELENLQLVGAWDSDGTGNALANLIQGNACVNLLDGGGGKDTLSGGDGDDTYLIDSADDTSVELQDQGFDTVRSSVSWALAAHTERLELQGSTALSGTGNELDNELIGNAEANVLAGLAGDDLLDGGAGSDTMTGGLGDDHYCVDRSSDVVNELDNEGIDTVTSSLSMVLGQGVENLVLVGDAAFTGTGNALGNQITTGAGADQLNGQGGDDTLDGGAGADTLIGGQGNDLYLVDSALDRLVEASGEGMDTVLSCLDWKLTANFEQLTLVGVASANGTGNAAANLLTGNSAANTLNGGAGADTMQGGLGDDVYIVSEARDTVIEQIDAGIDTISTGLSLTLSANVERLVLSGTAGLVATGNTLDNQIVGSTGADTLRGLAGQDTLDGGSGADSLIGGVGNDLYIVDQIDDVVGERANEGLDTVGTSVSMALGSNLENLFLRGATGLSGTGNGQNNVIIGSSGNDTLAGVLGNDTLDGGEGQDSMLGGSGDDVFLVDDRSDTVTEFTDAGLDTVQSSVDWTLGSNVEDLRLTGEGLQVGIGNAQDNLILGSTQASNRLAGAQGSDTLVGGSLDVDLLMGDSGNDTYRPSAGCAATTIAESGGTDAGDADRLEFNPGITQASVNVQRQGDDLTVTMDSLHHLTLQSWFTGADRKIEFIEWGDGSTSTGAELEAMANPVAGGSDGRSTPVSDRSGDPAPHSSWLHLESWMRQWTTAGLTPTLGEPSGMQGLWRAPDSRPDLATAWWSGGAGSSQPFQEDARASMVKVSA